MSTKEGLSNIVSDHWAFIGVAYVLTFGIWTGVTGNDFISSSWRSVKSTRIRGLWHLGLTTIPMLYMIAYMTFQALGGDFKEMWTAVIAFAFAVLHVLRTICGLWQVHIFKQWIVQCIICLESLGYYASNCGLEKCDPGCPNKGRKFKRGKCPRDKGSQKERINRRADAVLVNETLVDNRLSEGEVTCFLRFLRERNQETTNDKSSKLPQICLKCLRVSQSLLSIPSLLWNVARSKTSAFTSPSSRIFLEPRRPEEIWLGWACVLVAEVFPEFLKDLREAKMDSFQDLDSRAVYDICRAKFARELLLNAGLHTQFSLIGNRCDGDDKVISQYWGKGGKGGNIPQTSCVFLPWKYWDQDRFPKLCSGVFSKQEFLAHAVKSGQGLPFGIQHKNAKSLQQGKETYGYSRFAVKLDRTRESLPAEVGEKIQEFGVNELEWLAVFLTIPEWGATEHAPDKKEIYNEDEDKSRRNGRGAFWFESRRTSIANAKGDQDSPEQQPCNDSVEMYGESFAVSNLRDQLGFKDNYECLVDNTRMESFPLLRHCVSKTLWGNRNLLEVSVHIDNFLALSSGAHVSHMFDVPLELKNKCQWEIPSTARLLKFGESVEERDRLRKEIWDANSELVAESLMHQFSLEKPKYRYLEQTMTFLGCSIEQLRSSLARWTARNWNDDAGVWRPVIRSSAKASGDLSETSFRFQVSDESSLLISCQRDSQSFHQNFVQMHVLWELQNYFQSVLPSDGVSPSDSRAIILCVLSFPALKVNVREVNHGGQGETVEIAKCSDNVGVSFKRRHKLEFHAVCGPQKVYVTVVLENKGKPNWDAIVQLGIESEKEEDIFLWEAWRDAFGGRLDGVRLWQKRHQMPSVTVNRSWRRIETGIQTLRAVNVGTMRRIQIWSGWLPLRVAVSQFEVETWGLILRRREIQTSVEDDLFNNIGSRADRFEQQTWVVGYASASHSELQHTSVIAHEAIRKICNAQEDCSISLEVSMEDIQGRANEAFGRSASSQRRLGLLLTENIAIGLVDFSVVKSAVELLVRQGAGDGEIARALSMIERFLLYISLEDRKDANCITEVLCFLESLLDQMEYESAVSEWYARICTPFKDSQTKNLMDKICAVLCTSLFRTAAKDAICAERARNILASSFSCEEEDKCTLSLRILFPENLSNAREDKIIDTANRLWRGRGMAENKYLAIKLFRFAVRERENATAMRRLGEVFQSGDKSIPANAPDALLLYERAVEKGDLNAMVLLALLLKNGAPGVSVNSPRAVQLLADAINQYGGEGITGYVLEEVMQMIPRGLGKDAPFALENLINAIEKFGKCASRIRAARFLRSGVNALPADTARAIALLRLAIHDSKDSDAIVALKELIDHPAAREMLGNDLPAVVRQLVDSIGKSGNLPAKIELAKLLKEGASGLPTNTVRAEQLIATSIDELDTHLTCSPNDDWVREGRELIFLEGRKEIRLLEKIFKELNNSRWADAPHIVEKSMKAVEKFGMWKLCMYGACRLYWGYDGLQPNRLWAIHLLKRAIDEVDGSSILHILQQVSYWSFEKSILEEIPSVVKLLVELEREGSFSSRLRLAVLLKKGCRALPADSQWAVKVLGSTIDEIPKAINNPKQSQNWSVLRGILSDIKEGSWADAPDMVKQLLHATAKSESVTAMIAAAGILQNSIPGTQVDSAFAAEILKNAIDRSVEAKKIENLAQIASDIEQGMWKDAPGVVEKYTQAVEEIGDFPRKIELSIKLKKGAGGFQGNTQRAVDLLSRAVKNCTRGFSTGYRLGQILDTIMEGLWEDAPLVAEQVIGVIAECKNCLTKVKAARLLNKGAPGVSANAQRAAEFLRLAISDFEDKDATFVLNAITADASRGERLFEGVPAVIEHCMNSIEKSGNLETRGELAYMLSNGINGIPLDASRAVRLYTRAIEEDGSLSALISLAQLVQNGRRGVAADGARAAKLFQRAIDIHECASARYLLAVLLQYGGAGFGQDTKRAVELFTEASEKEPYAVKVAHNLAVLLEQGGKDFAANAPKSFALYEEIIDCCDHFGSLYNAAVMLKHGAEGVRADPDRAAQLYKTAVDAGGPVCAQNLQNDLSIRSVSEGTDDRSAEAIEYIREIEHNDDVRAMHNLGVLLQVGAPGVPANREHAVRLYTRAAFEGGHVGAMEKLAAMLQEGAEHIPADPEKAAWWLKRSKVFE